MRNYSLRDFQENFTKEFAEGTEKVSLLVGQPGIGKISTTSHIAKKMLQDNLCDGVLFISDHAKVLYSQYTDLNLNLDILTELDNLSTSMTVKHAFTFQELAKLNYIQKKKIL